MNEAWLSRKREQIFNGEDQQLYMHLGYYLSWFSAVEARLTMLIAMLTDSRNLENFDILIKNSQPRRKVEAIQHLARKHRPIGPNLQTLLSAFYDTQIPLRNNLSHSRLVHAETTPNAFCFTSLSQMNEGQGGRVVSSIDLFEHAYWLHTFQDDIGVMLADGLPPKRLEIDDPRTPLHKQSDRGSPRPKNPANPSRRERKRMRKGLPPRGNQPDQQ